MLTVRDIVERADFRLTVIAASETALARQPQGAFVTDLSDPRAFLPPSSVVFTSGLWTQTPAGVSSFLDALAVTNATALVFGLLEIGTVPSEVLDRCAALDIPVIVTADDVVYSDVRAQILAALESPVQDRVFREVSVVERLAALPVGDERAAAVLRELSAFGLDAWLVSRDGSLLTWTGAPPADEDMVAMWSLAARFPDRTHDRADRADRLIRAWSLDGGTGGNPAHLAVRANTKAELPKPDSIMIMSVRAVLGAELLERDIVRSSRRASVGQLVELLSSPAITPVELSARFRLEGRRTTGASRRGVRASLSRPTVVRRPATSKQSLIVTGQPASIPGCSPRVTCLSTLAAAASAAATSSSVIAPMAASRLAMVAR
ncbi:PucR family transcriptional regulator ligand-binding domain-containing protein [Pseudofrankia sp. DC12]|uniref:PucR family transcriptional regulator ligand-binding domain-containing protein n=1 Tax=Pseudofrankia sp. DC12 TaxID=683315 RepID=UPI0005F83433|nr:PucR family transcriptional regulator ligand-binding domain-containing protein [Pseudofrankia sp. DC12]